MERETQTRGVDNQYSLAKTKPSSTPNTPPQGSMALPAPIFRVVRFVCLSLCYLIHVTAEIVYLLAAVAWCVWCCFNHLFAVHDMMLFVRKSPIS